MKRLIVISGAAFMLASCAKQEQALPYGAGTPLVLEVTVGATKATTDYRAEKYFALGGEFESATVDAVGTTVSYTYDGGLLVPAGEAIVFPKDGSGIGRIVVKWPTDAQRLSQAEPGAIKDQTTAEAFFASDWLKATLNDVVPSTVVPISFDHERCKITFAVTGENAGKKIKSLTIAGYKAYCDPDTNEAQLMYDFQYDKGSLPSGTTGTIQLEGIDGIIDIMILDSPDELLTKAGDNCTVNLNL